MDILILVCVIVPAITALVAWLTRDRTNHSNQPSYRLFLRPPLIGTTDPHKSGLWYTTNSFVGEKVNEAIMRGKEGYAHKRSRSQRRQKRSR